MRLTKILPVILVLLSSLSTAAHAVDSEGVWKWDGSGYQLITSPEDMDAYFRTVPRYPVSFQCGPTYDPESTCTNDTTTVAMWIPRQAEDSTDAWEIVQMKITFWPYSQDTSWEVTRSGNLVASWRSGPDGNNFTHWVAEADGAMATVMMFLYTPTVIDQLVTKRKDCIKDMNLPIAFVHGGDCIACKGLKWVFAGSFAAGGAELGALRVGARGLMTLAGAAAGNAVSETWDCTDTCKRETCNDQYTDCQEGVPMINWYTRNWDAEKPCREELEKCCARQSNSMCPNDGNGCFRCVGPDGRP